MLASDENLNSNPSAPILIEPGGNPQFSLQNPKGAARTAVASLLAAGHADLLLMTHPPSKQLAA